MLHGFRCLRFMRCILTRWMAIFNPTFFFVRSRHQARPTASGLGVVADRTLELLCMRPLVPPQRRPPPWAIVPATTSTATIYYASWPLVPPPMATTIADRDLKLLGRGHRPASAHDRHRRRPQSPPPPMCRCSQPVTRRSPVSTSDIAVSRQRRRKWWNVDVCSKNVESILFKCWCNYPWILKWVVKNVEIGTQFLEMLNVVYLIVDMFFKNIECNLLKFKFFYISWI
jgi:hypothetical protein